jgi:hypothetical protein
MTRFSKSVALTACYSFRWPWRLFIHCPDLPSSWAEDSDFETLMEFKARRYHVREKR